MSSARAISRPSQSRFYSIRQLRFHVRHWPAPVSPVQPLKVILHGWMDVSATWQRLVDFLPAQWAIAAPDQRGFGYSQAGGDNYWFYDYVADLDLLLDELSPDQPVDLIGHSMGSQIAALYAGVRPDRIRKLVVLDGFYLPQAAAQRAPDQLRHWLKEVREVPRQKHYPDLANLAERIAKRQPGLDADGALFVAQCWSEPTEDGQIRLLGDPRHRQRGPLLYRDEEAKAIFSKVTAPTLIVDAGASHMLALGQHEVRQQRIACFANSTKLSIDKAGHMLHFDAPAATGLAIKDFLGG